MAQTKKKRQTKHRGNAAGVVEARGRTGRPPSPEERKRIEKEEARAKRLARPPSWRISARNSAMMALFVFIILSLINKPKHGSAVPAAALVAVLMFAVYIPAGYYIERYMWKRRLRAATDSLAPGK